MKLTSHVHLLAARVAGAHVVGQKNFTYIFTESYDAASVTVA
jgi:hypothetical protein